jgi:hypothetical protein
MLSLLRTTAVKSSIRVGVGVVVPSLIVVAAVLVVAIVVDGLHLC